MKTLKFPIALAVLMLSASALFTSCKKTASEKDEDTSEASDHALAENTSSDIMNIGSQASDNNAGNLDSYKLGNGEEVLTTCATVKRDSLNKIDSVIFNNSTCLDGRTRNGILIFNYSASTNGAKHYRDPGFSCIVTSSGYTVDGNAINIINKSISNTTPFGFNPASTNLTWNTVSHIQVTKAEGTLDFSCNRTKTLLNTSDANVYHGAATPISWKLAKIGITGSGSGTTVKGISFSGNTTSMLVRDFGGCTISGKHPFISGALDFTPGTKATRHIDFGDGTCDLNATVTINGITKTITLK